MEEIKLTVEISCQKFGFDEAADLRRDISKLLDKALRDAGVGRWSGGVCGLATMEIFLKATDPDKAIDVINSALADHWILPLMEIKTNND